ncbi:hypothetical protein MVES_003558 [Malassezia vespertilionis]|uniref:tRNA ligase n=1 Tax=Malassezia vespertilionis TaxID=2020962 RepID=A0A2N1J851_9BASI|nr:hypothetical protein MVES_003558 [Malassezia vespertilionis]
MPMLATSVFATSMLAVSVLMPFVASLPLVSMPMRATLLCAVLFVLRCTLYTVGSNAVDPKEHAILSWKAQEFAYRQFSQDSNELPTLARGLFTEQVTGPNGEDHQRILVRGYDKFFNVGELAWTQPAAIKAFSTGPYIVSYKENGCIVFVAALTQERLVVTSKHAIGNRAAEEEKMSHAEMGRVWLQRHLARSGRSEAQLARELWDRDETAVMELCDDEFEEHVLRYPQDRTGLHLHGLNANAVDFATRTMEEVQAFAEMWGFIPVRFRTFATLAEVDAFASEVGKTGSLHGEPMEGFVVRTKMRNEVVRSTDAVQPPYKPGQTWFYKIKFDEPYLMYRDWRELTRTMLSERDRWNNLRADAVAGIVETTFLENKEDDADVVSSLHDHVAQAERDFAAEKISKKELKRVQKRLQHYHQRREKERAKAEIARGTAQPCMPLPRSQRPETHLYVQWVYDRLYGNCEREIEAEPALFTAFHEGHGIIALREKFLAFLETPQGQAQLQLRGGEAARDLRTDDRPFEKTLLIPIAVPGSGKTALGVALTHLFSWAHAQSDDVQNKRTGPAFLKLVESAFDKSGVVIADRNNHLLQHRDELVDLCLRVEPGEEFQYKGILTRFIKDMQTFRSSGNSSDDQIDELIWLDLGDALPASLDRILDRLCPMLGLQRPPQESIDAALCAAESYVPAVRKPLPSTVPKSSVPDYTVHPSSYIAVFVHLDAVEVAMQVLDTLPATAPYTSAHTLLSAIKEKGRAVARPHITLVHQMDSAAYVDAHWDTLFSLATRSVHDRPSFFLTLTQLAWNDRVMAFKVGGMHADAPFQDLSLTTHKTMHITVGTADAEVEAVESSALFGDTVDAYVVSIQERTVHGVLGFHSNPKKATNEHGPCATA